MADPVPQVGTQVWLGGYDLSPDLNSVNLRASRVELPDGRLGDDIVATYPGIMQVDAQTDGFYSTGAGSSDPVHAARIITKEAAEWPLTVLPPSAPGAAGADGNVAYNLRAAQFAMYFGAEHGQSLPFRGTSRARTGRLDRATVVLPKALRTGTTNGAGHELGAVAATQKLIAIMHTFEVDGGTWTVTIESDGASDFATPTTRATFGGATGIDREVIEVAGPITDTWWRAVLTETVAGTDVTTAVLLAIVPA